MKLKDILLATLVIAGSFTACTSEIPVDGPEGGEYTGDISVAFAVGDVTTKATTDDKYENATDAEIQINNYFVALFGEDGSLIGGKNTDEPVASNNATVFDGKKYYTTTFNNISSKQHSTVTAIVIANYKGKRNSQGVPLDFSSCKTKSDFGDVLESANFETVNSLIKVGTGSTTLTANIKGKIEVPLTQLTARFDFKEVIVGEMPKSKAMAQDVGKATYTYLGKGAVEQEILNILQAGIPNSSEVIWEPKTQTYDGWFNEGDWPAMHYTNWEKNLIYGGYFNVHNTDYFWIRVGTYHRNAYYQERAILVKKEYTEIREALTNRVLTRATTSDNQKYFTVTNITYFGTNLKSDLAIFDNKKLQNTKNDGYKGTGNLSGKALSFYSYEGTLPLKLSISGYISDHQDEGGEGEVDPTPTPETKTYKVTEYGYILQERGTNGWGTEIPSSEDLATMGSKFVSVQKEEQEVSTKALASGSTTKAGSTPESKTYTLELPGSYIKGNCYEITGYVTAYGFELGVKVAPWTERKVDVGFDSDKYK